MSEFKRPGPEWKDTTNYVRGERGQIEPRRWERLIGGMRVIIHRHLDYEPDVWLLTTDAPCLFLQAALKSKDIEDATKEAVRHIASSVRTLFASVEAAL